MQRKIISIVIATYNSGATLEECLNSIFTQTNSGASIFIVDGNSTDNTNDIIRKYRSKIEYYISEPDNGVYDAWNKILPYIETDWVMFLGSDDVLHLDAVECYIRHIEENKDVNLVLSKAELIGDNKEFIRVIGEPWDLEKFKRYMNVVHTGSVTHISLFSQFGKFNSKYKIAGDYDFLLRCSQEVRAGFINSSMMKMRHGGLSTSHIHQVFFETFCVKREILGVKLWNGIFDLFLSYLKFYTRSFFNAD